MNRQNNKDNKNNDDTIIIPELEEQRAAISKYHAWSKKQEAIMDRYYGLVDSGQLAKTLGVTINVMRQKAGKMGMSFRSQQERFREEQKGEEAMKDQICMIASAMGTECGLKVGEYCCFPRKKVKISELEKCPKDPSLLAESWKVPA